MNLPKGEVAAFCIRRVAATSQPALPLALLPHVQCDGILRLPLQGVLASIPLIKVVGSIDEEGAIQLSSPSGA